MPSTPRRPSDPFAVWLEALETRHLADVTFAEARRAVQALSRLYVEERPKLATGAALRGRGKRAAFALFYGPLHFLMTRHVVRALELTAGAGEIWDLGCGSGASGAAWALERRPPSALVGVDRHPWALEETRWTYRILGLPGRVRRAEVWRVKPPGGTRLLAAFTVNELAPEERDRFWSMLTAAFRRGAAALVIEPIARRPVPWWDAWTEGFRRLGGRDDTWRFPADLPESLRRLDRAAGLDHRELTCRSLWLPARRAADRDIPPSQRSSLLAR